MVMSLKQNTINAVDESRLFVPSCEHTNIWCSSNWRSHSWKKENKQKQRPSQTEDSRKPDLTKHDSTVKKINRMENTHLRNTQRLKRRLLSLFWSSASSVLITNEMTGHGENLAARLRPASFISRMLTSSLLTFFQQLGAEEDWVSVVITESRFMITAILKADQRRNWTGARLEWPRKLRRKDQSH